MVHIPLMFLPEWREFLSAPCLAKKKLDDSSRLHVAEIARVAWHASFQLCNKKRLAIRHMNRPQTPLSDTIDSVIRHREVCRAKDFSAPPRGMCCFHIYPDVRSIMFLIRSSMFGNVSRNKLVLWLTKS